LRDDFQTSIQIQAKTRPFTRANARVILRS